MGLTREQQERYARQLSLPEIGSAGQERLATSRVLLVGVGGLGSAVGFYLAAAGIGTLGLADDDVVALSNLQRRTLYRTADVGRAKVDSAAERLRALNPDVALRPLQMRLTAANAGTLVGGYDIVVDAADNFATKFLIADACHAAGRPYSHAGIQRFTGQTMTVLPGRSACYRCVFGGPPPADTAAAPQGPLGVVPGVIGCIQATEVLKVLLGLGDLLTDRLLTYDALALRFRCVPLRRDPSCPLCAGSAGEHG
jgi:molybdopterin/thiamine biosynthesis adenylyltransferase